MLRIAIRLMIVSAILFVALSPAGNQPARVFAQVSTDRSVYLPMVNTPSQAPQGGNCGMRGGDWPMVAANPQRTSWTDEEVCGNLHVVWYRPIEGFIPQNVQLIAANNLVYVTTSAGLVALNAHTGDVAWRFNTGMPLGNSPTISGTVAYVGGYDHRLYAINALTGAFLWSFNGASAGYSANPLVVDGKVIVGNRDGYMYAIGAHGTGQQGQQIWRFKTDGVINYSAAYQDGVVYFASNDNFAYAVNAANGSQVWKSSKLPGDGYNSYWAVIYRDRVIFTGASGYRNGYNPGTMSVKDAAGEGYGGIFDIERDDLWPNEPDGTLIGPNIGAQSWSDGKPVTNMSRVTEYQEQNPNVGAHTHKPWRRVMVVLNRSNGQEWTFDSDQDGYRETIPVTMYGTRSGNRYPPIIDQGGLLYAQNDYQRGSIPQGQVMGWSEDYPSLMSIVGGRSAVDEPQAISGGGNLIYRNLCCDRVGEYFSTHQPGSMGNLWGYDNTLVEQAPGYDSMWYGTDPNDPVRLRGNYGTLNGIYHNHGDQNAIIPYAGKLFVHRSNAVIAYGSTASLGGLPTLPEVNVDPAVPVPSENELRALLETEVLKIINAGLLRPGYYNNGQFLYTELGDYFTNPGDTLLTLTTAYPYLSAATQNQLRTYLGTFFDAYFDPVMYGQIGWSGGAGREAMPIPPEVEASFSSFPNSQGPGARWTWSYPQVNFYAMWKYAQIFPQEAGQVYSLAKNKLQVPVPSLATNDYLLQRPWEHNGYVAGYYGFLQLQTLANMAGTDASLRTQVTNELNRLQSLRASTFQKDPYYAFDERYHFRVMNVARNFMMMTPEFGLYLRQNAMNRVGPAIDEYDYTAPYWFVSRFNAVVNEGVMQNLYDVNAMFLAKAYILGESRAELYPYLDVPAFQRGDLFYIQNLIALLQAPASQVNQPDAEQPKSEIPELTPGPYTHRIYEFGGLVLKDEANYYRFEM